jgi:hypothetical protein
MGAFAPRPGAGAAVRVAGRDEKVKQLAGEPLARFRRPDSRGEVVRVASFLTPAITGE